MKRYYLYNNLERRRDISVPVYQCIMERWNRGDVARLIAQEMGASVQSVKRKIADGQKADLYPAIEKIIDKMRQSIDERDLGGLPAIVYREKKDPSSGKIRTIGIESIEQQLYDEVADHAIQPLKKRIGAYQIACLRHRGGALGNRAMRRWMRDPRVRWVVQADIKKCYESIDRAALMRFLRHLVKGSPRVLWLVETLISTHKKGLNIGCKLSQDLVNIYLSVLYHHMTEQVQSRSKRRGVIVRKQAVLHALFQMDDIVLLCASRKDARIAQREMMRKAGEMGVTIKASWRCYQLDRPGRKGRGEHFVDIIGVRFYRRKRSLRRHVYIRARRGLAHVLRRIRTHRPVPPKLAQRVLSHTGCLKWTEHFKLWKKYKVEKIVRICRRIISHESKVLQQAGGCDNSPHGRNGLYFLVPA